MSIIAIIFLSLLLQLLAAGLAMRLAFTTGRVLAWALVTVALILMGFRRMITLTEMLGAFFTEGTPLTATTSQYSAESLALVISAIILTGVWLISPMFRERRSIAASLADSEAKYLHLLDSTHEVLFRMDLSGNVSHVSPNSQAISGYAPDELIGKNIQEVLINPSRLARFVEILDNNGGVIENYETEVRHKNGSTSYFNVSGSYIRDSAGVPAEIEGIVTDQTPLKQADILNSRLGRIIENAVNEIYVFDSHTRKFVLVNKAARDNLGYSIEELLEMTPLDLNDESRTDSFRSMLEPLFRQTVRQLEFKTRHRRKNGTEYQVAVRLQLAVNESPPVYFAVIEDITEKIATEAALRHSQKMEAIGQLTAGIAHDFNNLLTVIMGNLDLLEYSGNLLPEQRSMLESISVVIQRGARLTSSLLSFARKQALMPETVNLAESVSGMLALLKNSAGDSVEVTMSHDRDLHFCNIDVGQFQNALINLCINARDAMPQGGKLELAISNAFIKDRQVDGSNELHNAGDYVLLAVKDHGTGITDEVRNRMFEPFFSTKQPGMGTGLGLSMVYGFVKQSGGIINVESTVGAGSTFLLYFPATEPDNKAKITAASSPTVPGHGERVLLAEDDDQLRSTMASMLEMLGYQVVAAASGKQALEIFRRDPDFMLLLTDLMMPDGISGIDLAQAVTDIKPGMPVLYMTGYGSQSLLTANQLNTNSNLLSKPFSITRLSSMLDLVLGNKPHG